MVMQASSLSASPIPLNTTKAKLLCDIEGTYYDEKGIRKELTLPAGTKVVISAHTAKYKHTRQSSGQPGPEMAHEFGFKAALPDKKWVILQGTDAISGERIRHNFLSENPTSPSPKRTGKAKLAYWKRDRLGYIREKFTYNVGRATPSGKRTLDLGDCVYIRSAPGTLRTGGNLPEEPTDYNFDSTGYFFQYAKPVDKVPDWTSDILHTTDTFQII